MALTPASESACTFNMEHLDQTKPEPTYTIILFEIKFPGVLSFYCVQDSENPEYTGPGPFDRDATYWNLQRDTQALVDDIGPSPFDKYRSAKDVRDLNALLLSQELINSLSKKSAASYSLDTISESLEVLPPTLYR
jgi:hypothetical protein